MAAPKNQSRGTNNIVAQVADRINESDNVLVTLSKDPTVDELSAALGLTYILDKMGKHVTAIFSGTIPNVIEFLEPEKTFEVNTDSLRDFIIALDKEKADHLRYKVEGDYVKVFITPYRTNITEADMEFSHGDYNVDLVIALNVANEGELDAALTEYGRIMHDATSINISAAAPGKFGDLEWGDPSASSICEMVFSLVGNLDVNQNAIDKTVSTAFLTGIISATNRFSNERTSPDTFTIAARLMSAGADQRLISLNIPVDILTQELKTNNPEKTAKLDAAKAESKKEAKKSDNGTEVDLHPKDDKKLSASEEAERIAKETMRKAEEEAEAKREEERKAAEEKAAREKEEAEKAEAVRRQIEEKVAREAEERQNAQAEAALEEAPRDDGPEIATEHQEMLGDQEEHQPAAQTQEFTSEGSTPDWKNQKSYVNEIQSELQAPEAPEDPSVIKPAEPEDLHELYVPEPTGAPEAPIESETPIMAPEMPAVPALVEAPAETPVEAPAEAPVEAPVAPEPTLEPAVEAPIAPEPAPEYAAPSLTEALAQAAEPAPAEAVLPMPDANTILPPPPAPFDVTSAPIAPNTEEDLAANADDPVSMGELAPRPTEPVELPTTQPLSTEPSAMDVVSGIQANNPVMSTEPAPVVPEPILPEPVQAAAPAAVPAPAPAAEQPQGAVDPGAFQLPPLSN